MIILVNIALSTCVFLGAIGTAQGAASVTPRESMSGVPATPAMHFRNGAMAFTYISTMLLQLVDQNKGRSTTN